MTITNISASAYISGKLRQGYHDGSLVDYNSANRPANYVHFVYPDRPRIIDLLRNKNNFPRISVESMDESTISRLGMGSLQYHELVQLSINVWCPPNLTCQVSNTSSEDHTYALATDYYELDNLPVSIIGAAIDGTKDAGAYSFTRGIDYELVDNDYDGFSESIHWLGVNEPDDGTDFTCAYNRKASGSELCRLIMHDIHDYIKNNWLSWFANDKVLTHYKVISSRPVAFVTQQNIHRHELYCTFQGIDVGDSI